MEEKFTHCQSVYETALSKLEGLDNVKQEFTKLFKALEKTYESNQRLNQKTSELETEILMQTEKVSKCKTDDEVLQHSKKMIQEEIERNGRKIQEQKLLQREKQEKIEDIQKEIKSLNELMQFGSGWTQEQELKLSQLRKREADLSHTLEQKLTNLQMSRSDIELLSSNVRSAEAKKLEIESELGEIQQLIDANDQECKQAQFRRDRVDAELRNLKSDVERYQLLLASKEKGIAEGDEELELMDQRVRGAKQKMQTYLKQYDELFQQTHKLTEELEDQMRINKHLGELIEERERLTQDLDKEKRFCVKDMKKVKALIQQATKKIEQIEEQKKKAEAERLRIREKTKIIEREIATEKKHNESLQRQVDDLVKEREILNKTLVKAEERTKQIQDLIAVYGNSRKNLENEIQGYKGDAIRDRQTIEVLEEEVQKYEKQLASETQAYLNTLEEVKIADARILELQKKIQEGETKLKQQANLYEAVRSDRNLYSKNLLDAQEDIAEMKRKFKIMNHQITTLKDEITGKDHALVKEHFDHHKVEKEKEILRNELTKLQKQSLSSEQIIASQQAELVKLTQIMHDAEEEQQRQQKEYTTIISERDLLGTQLIKRNEELAALYERVKVQMSALRKGQAQYNEIVKHITNLRRTVIQLEEEKKQVGERIATIPALEGERIQLEREVAQERSKIKALSDELERPLNVHRWRKLESSDPERFALIRKIQSLQVKLIKKTEELAIKAQQIEEQEKLYVELKNVLARQPGPEVAEQLVVYQQNLKDKQRQMKEMEAQLDKSRAHVNELKFEIDCLNREKMRFQKQFIDHKRHEMERLTHDGNDDSDSDDSSDSSSDESDSSSDSSSDSDDDDDDDGEEEKESKATGRKQKLPSPGRSSSKLRMEAQGMQDREE